MRQWHVHVLRGAARQRDNLGDLFRGKPARFPGTGSIFEHGLDVVLEHPGLQRFLGRDFRRGLCPAIAPQFHRVPIPPGLLGDREVRPALARPQNNRGPLL